MEYYAFVKNDDLELYLLTWRDNYRKLLSKKTYSIYSLILFSKEKWVCVIISVFTIFMYIFAWDKVKKDTCQYIKCLLMQSMHCYSCTKNQWKEIQWQLYLPPTPWRSGEAQRHLSPFSGTDGCSPLQVHFSGRLPPCSQGKSSRRSPVSFSWERLVWTQPRLPFVSVLDQRRVHPAASAGLWLSWNITVLHSQIKVSSISLLCGVKLDLLTSWIQQPGSETVVTASVRGSIQLGIFFPPLWWKG